MSLDIPALRESFELVAAREAQITKRFYEILFERYPAARPLFSRKALEHQAKMLQEALVAVVDHLENAPWLEETLKAMGKTHLDYEVTEEMYPWVGECLLATFVEIAGPAWKPAYTDAWSTAYDAISGLMITGAQEAAQA